MLFSLFPLFLRASDADVFFKKSSQSKNSIHKLYYITEALRKNTRKDWPFVHTSYQIQGELFQKMGFYEEAIQSFHRALIHHPKNIVARKKIFECYYTLEKWQDVVQSLNMLQKEQKKFIFFEERAIAYYNQGFYKNAIEDFRQAFLIHRYKPKSFERFICCHFYEKKYFDLLKILENFDIPFLDKGHLYFFRGLTYFMMYYERKKEISRGVLFLLHLRQDEYLKKWKEKYEYSFMLAQRFHFFLENEGLWKKIPQVRQQMHFLLEAYILSLNRERKEKEFYGT